MIFFLYFLWGYKKKEIYILQNKTKNKKKKKKEKRRSGNWDLISFPHCSSVIGFFCCFFLSFYFSNIVLYIQLKVLLCKVLKLDKKQSKTHTLLQQAINTDPLYQCGSLTLTRSFTRLARASW